ncbi:type I restriction enzyme endonuclease domain-containing protein [Rosistilla ulvae]
MKRRLESAVTDNIRRHVLRILKQHGYPPDLDSEATKLVLEQAGALWAGWPR